VRRVSRTDRDAVEGDGADSRQLADLRLDDQVDPTAVSNGGDEREADAELLIVDRRDIRPAAPDGKLTAGQKAGLGS